LSKQGAKGGKVTAGRRKACVYWLLPRLGAFGLPERKPATSNKSVVHNAQTHIFVILRLKMNPKSHRRRAVEDSFLSSPKVLHDFSLRSRRQNKAWGGAR
jgi:hypothetical protein